LWHPRPPLVSDVCDYLCNCFFCLQCTASEFSFLTGSCDDRMSLEIEVKVPVLDTAAFLTRLESLGPVSLSPRHFEDNFVLDYPDGSIRSRQSLVRVRSAGNRACLTYKGPPRPEGLFKIREELETQVENAEVVLLILQQLGMRVWFRYQKYRQVYSVAAGSHPGEKVSVTLDETPIGNFAEFEGPQEAILVTAAAMGFDPPQFLRDSYYALYMQFCRKQGKPVSHMIFAPESGRPER
jgi:adenylate cyclase, class 2